MIDNIPEVKADLLKAIQAGDKEEIKRLHSKFKLFQWLQKFDGTVPIEAWLENDNPIVRFK